MSALLNAIVQHLQADAAVMAVADDVYPKLPPEGAEYPLITVMAQSAPAAERTFGRVAFEDAVYLVKAIDQDSSPKTAHDLNALIRTSLDRATITISGYTSLGISWERDIDYTEEFNGQTYQHEGGLYRLMAEAS